MIRKSNDLVIKGAGSGLSTICPECGKQVANVATGTDMDSGWLFYGKTGERWLMCSAGFGRHYRQKINGKRVEFLWWRKEE